MPVLRYGEVLSLVLMGFKCVPFGVRGVFRYPRLRVWLICPLLQPLQGKNTQPNHVLSLIFSLISPSLAPFHGVLLSYRISLFYVHTLSLRATLITHFTVSVSPSGRAERRKDCATSNPFKLKVCDKERETCFRNIKAEKLSLPKDGQRVGGNRTCLSITASPVEK